MSAAGTEKFHSRLGLSAPWAAAGLVVVSSLLHLLVAGGVDLSVDEAHYALYGLRPDWSYFDHPPMVGWLQALVLQFSSSEFALRLWPVALAALASLLVYRLARRLFPAEGPWLGFVAVALVQSMVVFQVLGIGLVPEDPLLVFALLAALALYSAVHEGSVGAWVAVGVAFGLAGLSKYTAVTLVISALSLVAVERRWRLLATPGPWLALGVALVLILPVLGWNMQHDWLSFRYQLGHGAPDRHWSALRFATGQGRQLLAYGPGAYVFGVVALLAALRQWSEPGVRFSVVLALPLLLLFGWSSGFETPLPHWTLLGWVALAPLTAYWLHRHWAARWVRIGAWTSVAYSTLLGVLLHTVLLVPWMPFSDYRHPLADLYGWRHAAQRAAELITRLPTRAEGRAVLFVDNWTFASRIAWYARPLPVQVLDERRSQFELWYGAPAKGARGVLILPDQARRHSKAVERFDHCEAQAPLLLRQDGHMVHTFDFYLCDGFHGR